MGDKKEFLSLQLEIDDVIIMDFTGVITQASIVDLARTVEATLVSYHEEEGKIRTIFEILVEVMQNILSYSYDSIDLGNNTFQSYGEVKISLRKDERLYQIRSGNLIDKKKQEGIESMIAEVNALDADALKEVYKERRRSRRHSHSRGAGLGFLDIARKSKNPLNISFDPQDESSVMFRMLITI